MNKFDNSPIVIDSIKKSRPVMALKNLLIKKISNFGSGLNQKQKQARRWLAGSLPPGKEREMVKELQKTKTDKKNKNDEENSGAKKG